MHRQRDADGDAQIARSARQPARERQQRRGARGDAGQIERETVDRAPEGRGQTADLSADEVGRQLIDDGRRAVRVFIIRDELEAVGD